ncbi:MAG: hypothetical protein ACPGJS_18045 [Flammeovirgaceae bacterium]
MSRLEILGTIVLILLSAIVIIQVGLSHNVYNSKLLALSWLAANTIPAILFNTFLKRESNLTIAKTRVNYFFSFNLVVLLHQVPFSYFVVKETYSFDEFLYNSFFWLIPIQIIIGVLFRIHFTKSKKHPIISKTVIKQLKRLLSTGSYEQAFDQLMNINGLSKSNQRELKMLMKRFYKLHMKRKLWKNQLNKNYLILVEKEEQIIKRLLLFLARLEHELKE